MLNSRPRVSATLLRVHDREKLYGEVWRTSLSELAKQYGVSDVTMWRRCRALHIPLPLQGHWQRMKSGLPVQQRPLLPEIQTSDESKKEWKSTVYSFPEIAQIVQRVSEAVSSGKTLEDACRITGIAITTYRRWRKRVSV
jgi:hypothetical protein